MRVHEFRSDEQNTVKQTNKKVVKKVIMLVPYFLKKISIASVYSVCKS